jgi:2,3-diaminopropionate biosynthesis protein SbnA
MSAQRTASDVIFREIDDLVVCPVQLKLEGINIAGSIKLKTATQIVDDLEESGRLTGGMRIIESSSGNLGVALALICAERGYGFTCVTDPNASPAAVAKMRALGADVITVREQDPTGNYLGTRIKLIENMCRADPRLLWSNQYANASNWRAHYRTTAPEILAAFPRVDYLVVGAGTTGTLMGCARYFREHSPRTVVVGVDATGSVTFGGRPAKRRIPGLGTSHRPPIADGSLIDELIMVDEVDAVRMCRRMARHGLPIGGSTGSVLHAVTVLSVRFAENSVVVAISADMAEKYLDTIYSDSWIEEAFPGAWAEPEEAARGAVPMISSAAGQ